MAVREVSWPSDVVSVARALCGVGEWFWLDGAAPEPGGAAGLSYLGAAVGARQAERGAERAFLAGLREVAAETPGTGWLGVFGYEFGVGLLDEDPAPDDVPGAFALRTDAVLVLDHSSGRAFVRASSAAAIEAWLKRFGETSTVQQDEVTAFSDTPGLQPTDGLRWSRGDVRYLDDVAACKRAIHDGDAYVLCLTDTAEMPSDDVNPLDLYLRIRGSTPAARGAVIVTAGRALVSASPERFLSKRGRAIATHPIKGTRARGEAPGQDARLAEELAADPKERAENLMIVDLMRNDLSRVCDPGTVRTDGFLRVESHPRVHQLVSTVRGELREGLDIYDAIESCFPGGSMTGAPKRRAVQILAELERRPRGLYSGCFGWIGDDGDAELAMTIRGVELRARAGGGQVALIGAGGGVTADSEPGAELAEMHLKASALLAAVRQSANEYP